MVDRDEHYRLSFALQVFGRIRQRTRAHSELNKKSGAADGHGASSHGACDPFAGPGRKIFDAQEVDPSFLSAGNDGSGQRVLASSL